MFPLCVMVCICVWLCVCAYVPRVGQLENNSQNKDANTFFSCTGFIFKSSWYFLISSVFWEGLGKIQVQAPGLVNVPLSWSACVKFICLRVLGAAEKSVLSWARLLEKEKKRKKKGNNKSWPETWNPRAQWWKLLARWEKCKLIFWVFDFYSIF